MVEKEQSKKVACLVQALVLVFGFAFFLFGVYKTKSFLDPSTFALLPFWLNKTSSFVLLVLFRSLKEALNQGVNKLLELKLKVKLNEEGVRSSPLAWLMFLWANFSFFGAASQLRELTKCWCFLASSGEV